MFTNLRLVAVVVVSAAIQMGMHYLPVMERVFQIVPLDGRDAATAFALGLIPVTVIELSKLVRRLPAGRAAG